MPIQSLERAPRPAPRSPASGRGPRDGAESPRPSRRRVLVVHEHEVVRQGLRAMLARLPWVDRCLTAADCGQALDLLGRYEPHVVIVDAHCDGAGPGLARAIRAQAPRTRVLLLAEPAAIAPAEARFAGAIGVLSPGASAAELERAVRCAAIDKEVFPSRGRAVRERLTAREHEVLRLIAAGATNREISQCLFVSVDTVKRDARLIFRKLGVRNRAQAVERGVRGGLLARAPVAALERRAS
jgi:DNA-binding NarL/FixJ family response regulator